MSTKLIKGIVIDSTDNGAGVPGARVMITNSSGELTSGSYQARADLDGNFEIEMPSIEVRGKYITATTALDKKTIAIPYPVPSSVTIDVSNIRPQNVDEVTVTANPDIVACVQKYGAGSWNYDTKTCDGSDSKLKELWTKHKVKILIAGGLIVAGIIIAVIASSKKK